MNISLLFFWRFFTKALKTPELKVLALSLFVAILFVTFLNTLNHNLWYVLYGQAKESFGGDLKIESSQSIPKNISDKATLHNLKHTNSISFLSMAATEHNMKLSWIKAIDDVYPIYGKLIIKTQNNKVLINPTLKSGEIWLAEDLINLMNLKYNDKISIGMSEFTITGTILKEPDALGSLMVVAPRVLINIQDVAATKIIQPGSRVQYVMLLKGTDSNIEKFKAWAESQKFPAIKLETANNGSPALARTLAVAQNYLGLVVVLTVLLASISILMGSQHYSKNCHKEVAILRTIGTTSHQIRILYSGVILLLGIMVITLAILGGYTIGWIVISYWGSNFSIHNFIWGIKPALLAISIGLLMLMGFAIPPILALKNVPAMQVFQKYNPPPYAGAFYYYFAGGLSILIMHLSIDNPNIGYWLLMCLTITLVMIMGLALFSFQIIKRTIGFKYLPLHIALGRLLRNQGQTISELLSFTLALCVVMVIHSVQYDLLNNWQNSLPEGTPNYFMINIAPNDIPGIKSAFKNTQVPESPFYPMIRGRITHINEMPVSSDSSGTQAKRKGFYRPLNLTWMAELPSYNYIRSGENWHSGLKNQAVISMESGIATRLGVNIGDNLTFDIGGIKKTAKVINLRDVEWQSFKPNFFVIFPPGIIDNLPATYLTTAYLKPQQKPLLKELLQNFQGITLFDIDEVIQDIQQLVAKISIGVQTMMLMIVVMGIMILYAIIITTMKSRLQEGAMVRVLGGSKNIILKSIVIEYALLGLLAGIFASLGAIGTVYTLAENIFSMPYQPNFKLIGVSIASSVVLVTILGLLGSAKISKVSPMLLLKEHIG